MSAPQNKSDKPLTPSYAWQPLTPRGIAAFAHATFTRLFIVQLIFAVIVAGAVIWFLRVAWFPVIADAVHRLPEAGAIRGGELDFRAPSPQRLAENARLALVVDVAMNVPVGHAADVEVTFQKNGVEICGSLGCWSQPYERRYIIDFNRSAAESAWGAWRWAITSLAGLATVLSLLVLWWAVALVYLPLAKLFAFFADRRVSWSGAWRISAASLLPGALIVAAGLVLYGFGPIDLFQLTLLYLLHIIAGIVFVLTSPFFLPVIPTSNSGKNPFGTSPTISESASEKLTKRNSPFSRRDD